ncbi:hypothetical protein HMPREF1987_00972 [Peptostreptococcaceae bacterium oral taxon 113 str. W5053]|nr:hypothetical protein HMPREF1987_00972 [Peptostreptococcaceae bacterium oral taxon 113 str. W5053]
MKTFLYFKRLRKSSFFIIIKEDFHDDWRRFYRNRLFYLLRRKIS